MIPPNASPLLAVDLGSQVEGLTTGDLVFPARINQRTEAAWTAGAQRPTAQFVAARREHARWAVIAEQGGGRAV